MDIQKNQAATLGNITMHNKSAFSRAAAAIYALVALLIFTHGRLP
jgi:hypothetical protein